jgi:undecaprenyl diphosphate synthase
MDRENSMPACVGFIMDGNRRWARNKGLETLEGHQEGYAALKRMIEVVRTTHIPHMVCYAFSTENWNRKEEEVSYLMTLFKHAIADLAHTANESHARVRFRFVGERERFDAELQNEMNRVENMDISDPELTVWIALSYGGRAEIVDAVNRAISIGAPVTEETFATLLWTGEMPDPDIVIRTSGEKRISNFLLWKSAYSEFFFIDTLWPDFGKTEFQSILEQYAKRVRRIGK